MGRIENSRADVVIIGAGAAGLAAARRLREKDLRVVILEARQRIGGRIYTARDRRSPLPIELGAEFLHGEATETRKIVDAANLTAIDVEGERWRATAGRLSKVDDFWLSLDRILGRADGNRKSDRPLGDLFAERPGGRRFAEDRALAREFVEGFHAAEIGRMSERAIAEGGNPGEDPAEQRMARLLEGYSSVTDWLAAPLRPIVRLGCVASEISWSPGRVRVLARRGSGRADVVSAAAAVITVPISLLHTMAKGPGTLDISPDVPVIRGAAACAAMGHVRRITLLFDRPLLEMLDQRRRNKLRKLAFIMARGVRLPVWWTLYPARSALMVGWAGGPAALTLEAERAAIGDAAVSSLAEAIGCDRRTIARHLLTTFSHDWTRDPFSRGAYSYPLVGAADLGKRLSRPIERTLFFAGEAADPEGRNGTVTGALGSGHHAAKQVMRALNR